MIVEIDIEDTNPRLALCASRKCLCALLELGAHPHFENMAHAVRLLERVVARMDALECNPKPGTSNPEPTS